MNGLVFLMDNRSVSLTRALAIRNHLHAHAEQVFRFEETKVARWRSGRGNQGQHDADKSIFFAHLIDQLEAELGNR